MKKSNKKPRTQRRKFIATVKTDALCNGEKGIFSNMYRYITKPKIENAKE